MLTVGTWLLVRNVERDLTKRSERILKDLGVLETVKVTFSGPVASLEGRVPSPEMRTQIVEKIESLENIWGLHVAKPNSLKVVTPQMPLFYRLSFANREIKITGNLPGRTEKKALLAKVSELFPAAGVMDETTLPAAEDSQVNSRQDTNPQPRGMWFHLLRELPTLNTMGQLRWVTLDDGTMTVSANVPSEEAGKQFEKAVAALGGKAVTEEIQVITTPTIEIKFDAAQQLTVSGKLGSAADQGYAQEFFKKLFPKAKDIVMDTAVDEAHGPFEWLTPHFKKLPDLQKLGRIKRFVASAEPPVLEAEAPSLSNSISLKIAIDQTFQKRVVSDVSVASAVINSQVTPAFWATVREDGYDITGSVAEEEGKAGILTKLKTLLPNVKITQALTLNQVAAPTKLYLPALDPLAELISAEPNMVIQGFGLAEGRLKLSGIVPDNVTRDKFTGMLLKQFKGRVNADITVDPAYQLSPEASWTLAFSADKCTISGQVSSKQLKTAVAADILTVYPTMTVDNQLEVIPSGLRKGEWASLLPGLPVVAAREQIVQVVWNKQGLNLQARVPSEAAKQAMTKRIRITYGQKLIPQLEVVNDPVLADQPAVSLVDCTIYFGPSQKDFIALEVPTLQRVADLLAVHPDLKIRIEGHTDSKGTITANLNTSQLRCENVRKWIMRRGISADRIAIQAYGPRRPVADLKTDEGRAACRRLQFLVQ